MALQAGHIRWILGELSVRTLPQMTGEQAEKIMMAQNVVKEALLEELKAAEAVQPKEEIVMEGPAPAPETE